ncbi:MAG TPA: TonB-dependent receptor [Vicinamibacterales bacterium]|nr:TonB-dependent receptor [Vicinamibacterales bacterium]
MTSIRLAVVCGLVWSLALSQHAIAQTGGRAQGRIEGKIVRQDGGAGVGGVTVVVEELGRAELTDADGTYAFQRVPPGTYTVLATLGPQSVRERVTVTGGVAAQVRSAVDWPPSVFESVTVTATTRLPSRLVEAPAAVTVLPQAEIAPQALHGQLPRLLASTPGVEIAQSGLYDFNLNSRGFNTYYNRHVLTRIDGRDPSIPLLLGYVDWASLSMPLDDVGQLEFVRGPGAALYGSGAFNGVLNVKTLNPRDSLGGKVRYTFGELDTQRVEFRQAVSLGGGWYLKGMGGHHRSGDFTRSRVDTVEYAPLTLPRDLVAPVLGKDRLTFGSVRLDKYAGPSYLLTFEGGTAHEEGPVTLSPVARTQTTDVDQPWFRVNVAHPRWNLLGYYNGYRLDASRNLTAGSLLFNRSSHVALEGQANQQFASARGRVIAGFEIGREAADTADPDGVQTVFDRARSAKYGSIFGQVEYRLAERLNAVASARWDQSTLHDGRISPRGALVYTLAPFQTVRVTYGKAFQASNLTGYYLRFPVAPPVDLSGLEAALAPVTGGAPLGFRDVPILALGNENLRVERIDSAEVGYQGVIGGRLLLSASVYHNRLHDFVSNLLPQVGTTLGRLNPSYGPYQPPSSLSPQAAAAVTGTLQSVLPSFLFDAMSNDENGAPVFALLSFSNFGSATTTGVELGATYLLPRGWRAQGSYTGFHSSVRDITENPLLANTPEHQFAIGMSYDRDGILGAARFRWVSAFDWLAGTYAGAVPDYGVLDLNGSYAVTPRVSIGADVANALDNDHYEAFGGDLLGRRALVHVTYGW